MVFGWRHSHNLHYLAHKSAHPHQAEKLGALADRVESLVNENEGLLEELHAVKKRQGAAAAAAASDGEGPLVAMLKAENAALHEETEAVRGLKQTHMCVPRLNQF